jgi:methyltransferase (TIGR00027 family)
MYFLQDRLRKGEKFTIMQIPIILRHTQNLYLNAMEKIEHVSDTALMVAACRAIETERPDGLMRDPFAAQLAGAKGMGIARNASAIEWMCLGIGLRTRAIDELLSATLAQREIKTVVNMGAGLDTRPWRLKLHGDLRWIEVDFAEMLAYKEELLRSERPHCRLERLVGDVSRESDRTRIFTVVGDEPALMLTEGLLMYLPRQAVSALARESVTQSGIQRWIFDVSSLELMRQAHGDMLQAIDNVRADDHLNGRDVLDTALAGGWTITEHRSYPREAMTIAQERVTKLVNSSEQRPDPPGADDPSGVYLLSRQDSAS